MHRCWKLSVVLVGLAVGSHTLWAQTIACQGSVQGKILANENQQPLVGATVYVRELKTGATTDTTGIFRLSALCKGQYTVEYQYIGYKSVSMPIVVNTDSTLILQPVQLVADSRTLQEVVISEHRSEAQQLLQTQSSLSGAANHWERA